MGGEANSTCSVSDIHAAREKLWHIAQVSSNFCCASYLLGWVRIRQVLRRKIKQCRWLGHTLTGLHNIGFSQIKINSVCVCSCPLHPTQ